MRIENMLKMVVVIAGLALVSCAAEKKEETKAKAPDNSGLAGELTDADGKPAPKWVTNPAQAKPDPEKKMLCGEGSMGGSSNMSLVQKTANDNGDVYLSGTLQKKVANMLKSYQATTTGGADFGKAANDEQHVENVSKLITKTVLSGSETYDTWISSKGTLHALRCIDVDKFKGLVGGLAQLKESIRQAVVERADRAFTELDENTAPQQ